MQPATRRRALAVAAALGLLGLAAVASAGSSVGEGDSRLRLPSLAVPLTIASTLVFLLGVVVLVAGLFARRGRGELRQRGMAGQLLVFLGIMLALLLWSRFVRPNSESTQPADGAGAGGVDEPAPQGGSGHASGDMALVFLVLAGGTILAVLAARRLPSGTSLEGEPGADPATAVSDVMDDLVASLRADPDPRRAVIGAYAGMEQALSFHGAPRQPSEAPFEYVNRALRLLNASAASVNRLTDLFERAMFSTHTIGADLQQEAVDALVAVRDELREGARV